MDVENKRFVNDIVYKSIYIKSVYKCYLLIIYNNFPCNCLLYQSSAFVNVNFLVNFHGSHDHVGRSDWLKCVFGGIQRILVWISRLFLKTSSIISFLFQRNVVHSGSSNQLGECIIKHHDLVSFAQRSVWIKVFCRGAKDRSWLVELYRVKLKFF